MLSFKEYFKKKFHTLNTASLLSVLILSGALSGGLSGCSTNDKADPYLNWPADKIYNKGHAYLKKNNYNDAITAYESLNSQYPFSPPSKNGDLELIYAYYLSGDSALSLAASSRYLKLYPMDQHADYAYYMAGVIEFNNGRGFLEKYLPYQMDQHQSDNYQAAFNNFNQVITLFPQSIYAQDCRRRMMYLNNSMAQHNLDIAQYYFSQKAYLASASRALNVIIQYPTTPASLLAMKLLSDSYQAMGLNNLADSTQKYYLFNLNQK